MQLHTNLPLRSSEGLFWITDGNEMWGYSAKESAYCVTESLLCDIFNVVFLFPFFKF